MSRVVQSAGAGALIPSSMALALSLLLLLAPVATQAEPIKVASKAFTESVLLGEMARLTLEQAGQETRHLRELGGSRIIFNSLIAGELDVYPEYTGTLALELLAD
ncbi:MAG: glycine betaine ABC transporter substrate-binding protein, partial [Wenzhouxiangellaceae bacterium]